MLIPRLERSPGPQERDQNRLPVRDVGGRRSIVEENSCWRWGSRNGRELPGDRRHDGPASHKEEAPADSPRPRLTQTHKPKQIS